MAPRQLVLDASACVDLLLGNALGARVRGRVAGCALHAPAHLDAEVLSAIGRLCRSGDLDVVMAEARLHALTTAPIQRHPISDLVLGAWSRRDRLRLADAVYVELAERLGLPLVTTDQRLHAVPSAEVIRS